MVVLGVTVQDHLSSKPRLRLAKVINPTYRLHIGALLSAALLTYLLKPYIENLISQTFFALKVLRSHGLSGNVLWDVTQANLINMLLFASPLWWGPYVDASEFRQTATVFNH